MLRPSACPAAAGVYRSYFLLLLSLARYLFIFHFYVVIILKCACRLWRRRRAIWNSKPHLYINEPLLIKTSLSHKNFYQNKRILKRRRKETSTEFIGSLKLKQFRVCFFLHFMHTRRKWGSSGLVFKRKWILLLLFLPSYLPPEKVLWERERPKLMSIFFTLVCACVCVCLGPTILVVYSCWASDTIYSFFSFLLPPPQSSIVFSRPTDRFLLLLLLPFLCCKSSQRYQDKLLSLSAIIFTLETWRRDLFPNKN